MGSSNSKFQPPPIIQYRTQYITDPALAQRLKSLQKLLNQTKERILKQKDDEIKSLKNEIEEVKRQIQHQQTRMKKELKIRQQQIQQMKKKLAQFKGILQAARKEAKSFSDPKIFHQKREETFVAFLHNLANYKFTDKLDKSGTRNHILIGPISVGKSRLLNHFLNLNLPTGKGETTLEAKVVTTINNVNILDSPGANDDFDFYEIENLKLFKEVDRVFILYKSSLKDISKIIQIMSVLKPHQTYLIRTQCDLFEEALDQKSLKEELQEDQKNLKQILKDSKIKTLPIFKTSAKSDKNIYDNQKAKEYLIRGESYNY